MSSSLLGVNHQPSSFFVLILVLLTIFISPENSLNNFLLSRDAGSELCVFLSRWKNMWKKTPLFQYRSIGLSTGNICQSENWPTSWFASCSMNTLYYFCLKLCSSKGIPTCAHYPQILQNLLERVYWCLSYSKQRSCLFVKFIFQVKYLADNVQVHKPKWCHLSWFIVTYCM